jgi:hypothetical protein
VEGYSRGQAVDDNTCSVESCAFKRYEAMLADKMQHPAGMEFADTLEGEDGLAAALVQIAALHEQLVQRHTKCGPGCLRKGKCRHLDRASSDYSSHPDTVAFPVPPPTVAQLTTCLPVL